MANNMENHDLPPPGFFSDIPSTEKKGYALSGKIMLSAIVVLFAVVVVMICLHIYARWYILRARRRHLRQRANLVFYVEPNDPNAVIFSSAARGLDAAVLRSLPVFVYSSETHRDAALECAVCLSEFEDNEKGRVLPNCKHSFHTDCIDMWFHSHSTCPLCRSPVEPVPEMFSGVAVSVVEPSENEPASSSGVSATCLQEERGSAASSSSLADRRKAFELGRTTIEVPRGYEFESELANSSPASQGFKSPYSRLLSLTRILSMNRKSTAVSPSSGIGPSGRTATPVELDIECGSEESTQPHTRVQTPI